MMRQSMADLEMAGIGTSGEQSVTAKNVAIGRSRFLPGFYPAV